MKAVISDRDRVRDALINATMPEVSSGPPPGIAWLRAHVPRFCDGPDHDRRRALVEAELAQISPAGLRRRARAAAGERLAHVRILAEALGFQDISVSAVEQAAAHYQPHEPDDPEADRAVAELVAAAGGVADECTAARISLLIQACQATGALVTNARRLRAEPGTERTADEIVARSIFADPPVRRTRRIVDGDLVELDLAETGLVFGAGPHLCPGREHALAIAAGIIEGSR